MIAFMNYLIGEFMDKNWADKNLEYLLSYIKPQTIFKPDQFYSTFNGTENSLNAANRLISDHIGIDMKTDVVFDHRIEASGDIKINGNSGSPNLKIYIASKYRDDRKAIGEILAHENSHAYLFINNIPYNSNDTNEKEMLTDLTGVVLGLGKLILNGTRVQNIVRSTLTGNVTTTKTLKLGYLDDELIEYVITKLEEL